MGSRISVPPQQAPPGAESISTTETNHHHGYHAGNSSHYRNSHPSPSSSLITATNCYVRGPTSSSDYRSGITARPRSLSNAAADVIGELNELDNPGEYTQISRNLSQVKRYHFTDIICLLSSLI